MNIFIAGFPPSDGGGIVPANGPSGIDPDFRAGANGFLLAQVDYDIIGEGTANFDLILTNSGVVNDETSSLSSTIESSISSRSSYMLKF